MNRSDKGRVDVAQGIMRDENSWMSMLLSHFIVLFFTSSSSNCFYSVGPYNVNGVPLRRVNQRYVIATSTKVPLDGVDASKIDDAFFSREKDGEGKINPEKKAAQEAIDNKLKANVEKVELLKGFLAARFRLRKADKPHLLKF